MPVLDRISGPRDDDAEAESSVLVLDVPHRVRWFVGSDAAFQALLDCFLELMRRAAQARVAVIAVIIIERDVHVDPAPEPGLKAGELRGELFLRVVRRQLLRRYALGGGIREGGVIVAPNFAHGCSPVDGLVVWTSNAGVTRAEISLRVHGDLVASVFPAFPARAKNHEPVPLQRHVRGVNAVGPATCRLMRRRVRGKPFLQGNPSRQSRRSRRSILPSLPSPLTLRSRHIDRLMRPQWPARDDDCGKTTDGIFPSSWK